ncbi:MAG: GNAT family N-acetyltransferase [Nisaea sp.]|uniref:GNAT family N-acetyltransferase n=1 Tax=Nisaea sp. TaxID=2024842 RepID=UPI001B24DB10|nr:GNAT family N-acetyltransferase [Nisaea sp.]MBO6562128.1 GNAT family N-acetyltransferase [Nisaea sp.]
MADRDLLRTTLDLPVFTERLCLRAYRADDLENVFRLRSNPEVVAMLYGDPMTREEAPEALARYLTPPVLEADGDELKIAVERREDGAYLGNLKLQLLSREHLQGEIGYVFDPRHQGRGYALEAARKALELGFGHFGMHRISAHCDVRNTGSWRLMEKLGMRREAHYREKEFFKGAWAEDFVYAILAREWASPEDSPARVRPA